jgi:hypothetical protein
VCGSVGTVGRGEGGRGRPDGGRSYIGKQQKPVVKNEYEAAVEGYEECGTFKGKNVSYCMTAYVIMEDNNIILTS